MIKSTSNVFWFFAGSQHLYGNDTLQKVAEHSLEIVSQLNASENIKFPLVFKGVLTKPEEILQAMQAANMDNTCVGVITWMHTFSPSKMWISGLLALTKPLLHLHTQFNRDIPWENINMDFMNLNQSAHGDREYGFIATRLKLNRKVIVGYWADYDVQTRINSWMFTAAGYAESKKIKVARFGDNMRDVAVTEGDKVEAQAKFGWSISGYGVGDLVDYINSVSDEQVQEVLAEYNDQFEIEETIRDNEYKWISVIEQAKIEIGIRKFLLNGGFTAFTTTFEDLHGLSQLPGLAVQRLMQDGYGFGAEGDWKTAALLRIMKVMAGFSGTSFMEDYTYHFEPSNELVLGSHMLEVCPSIAARRPRLAVYPLNIGGKADPARLVFEGKSGTAVCATLVDLGGRFRLIVNEVEAVQPVNDMPNLPVARVLWRPLPSLQKSAEAWIYAGGAHHTVFSYHVTSEQLQDFANMAGIECVVINSDTDVQRLQSELRLGEIYWKLN